MMSATYHRFVDRDLTVAIRRKDHLGADHRVSGEFVSPLLRSVHGRRQPRISALAERHVQDDDPVAELVLLDEKRARGELHVAGMRANGENDPRRLAISSS